jgi:hypothetical protein
VNGGGSAYLKFRLSFDTEQPQTITGTLTGIFKGVSYQGQPIDIGIGCADTSSGPREKAEVTKTETLNCDGAGGTVRPC